MGFERVDHSHVVPCTYLRGFACKGCIGMVLTDSGERRVISVRDAGVRNSFYKRHRPATGERIDDVEWSLEQIENAAAPILRGVEENWPLPFEDKRLLAEFFSIQRLRGPRWHSEYSERTKTLYSEYRREGRFDHPEVENPPELADECEARALSDSERMIRMISMSSKGAAAFGSMVWNLVCFPRPLLATSDHPVWIWLTNHPSRRPGPTVFDAGLLNALEVWVPVSPTAAILMTWLDERGDRPDPIKARRHHASAVNAFTAANAEKQLFYLPGTNPPIGSGRFYPLSTELVDGYSIKVAQGSRVRDAIGKRVNRRLGENLPSDYDIVQIAD